MEKIQGLISAENKNFEIISPMEKLESFFIRTVTDAQTKLTPTSGAVSTTQIGEFLTVKEKEKSILDKLVTGQTQQQKTAEPEMPTKPAQVQPEVQRRNEDLINKLAAQEDESKPVQQKENIESKLDEQKKVRDDLLKKLTESQINNTDKQPDENSGRAGNA